MSKLQELRSNPNNSINIVDIISLVVPDGKSKYIELLLKFLNDTPNIVEYATSIKDTLVKEYPFINKNDLDKFETFQLVFIYQVFNTLFDKKDLLTFNNFCTYNERNLIEKNDLTTYKSYEEIIKQVEKAEFKINEKELEKQIIKLYDDENWLLLKPLTYHASKKYGSNTKWCTTEASSDLQFNNYSSNGSLIYFINKVTNVKVAIHRKNTESEVTFWNQKDTKIDLFTSELPVELYPIIKKETADGVKTNKELFEEIDKKNKFLNY